MNFWEGKSALNSILIGLGRQSTTNWGQFLCVYQNLSLWKVKGEWIFPVGKGLFSQLPLYRCTFSTSILLIPVTLMSKKHPPSDTTRTNLQGMKWTCPIRFIRCLFLSGKRPKGVAPLCSTDVLPVSVAFLLLKVRAFLLGCLLTYLRFEFLWPDSDKPNWYC